MAPSKRKRLTQGDRFVGLDEQLQKFIPHVYAVCVDEAEFLGLNVKLMPDGSCLAIMKAYGSDGTPMVCFGSGYGYVGALLGLNGAIQGGRWKVDKPWKPGSK